MMQHSEVIWKCFKASRPRQSRRKFLESTLLMSLGIINTSPDPRSITFPSRKFELGQHVKRVWVNDDEISHSYGQEFRDYGVVVGMVWNMSKPTDNNWCYYVKWYELGMATVALPVTDYAIENELEAFNYESK